LRPLFLTESFVFFLSVSTLAQAALSKQVKQGMEAIALAKQIYLSESETRAHIVQIGSDD
jgi:hypothetical protein